MWKPSEFKRRKYNVAADSPDESSSVFPFLCVIPPCCGVSAADYVAGEDDAAAVYGDSCERL